MMIAQLFGGITTLTLRILFLTSLFLTAVPVKGQSVEEILSRMMSRNEWQDKALVEFRAQRKFFAQNTRFNQDSTMYVQTVFRRPDRVESTVTRHEGSKLIRSRVFDKSLEA